MGNMPQMQKISNLQQSLIDEASSEYTYEMRKRGLDVFEDGIQSADEQEKNRKKRQIDPAMVTPPVVNPLAMPSPQQIQTASISATQQTNSLSIEKTGPVSPIPFLAKPERLRDRELQAVLDERAPLPVKAPTQELKIGNILSPFATKEEILQQVEKIRDLSTLIEIAIKQQLMKQDERGVELEELLTNFQAFKEVLDKDISKISGDVRESKKIGSYFGTAQTVIGVSLAVVVIGSAIATAVAPPVGAAIITSVSQVITPILAVSGGIAIAGKGYLDYKGRQHSKKLEASKFSNNRLQEAMKDILDQLSFSNEQAVITRKLLHHMSEIDRKNKRIILTM